MNSINAIHEFLIQNGWDDIGYGEYLSEDHKFKIYVGYNEGEDKYIVRSAILPIFDRWANSGCDDYFDTSEEVIEFLKGECFLAAYSEVVALIDDGIKDGIIAEETYKLITNIIDVVSYYFDCSSI